MNDEIRAIESEIRDTQDALGRLRERLLQARCAVVGVAPGDEVIELSHNGSGKPTGRRGEVIKVEFCGPSAWVTVKLRSKVTGKMTDAFGNFYSYWRKADA